MGTYLTLSISFPIDPQSPFITLEIHSILMFTTPQHHDCMHTILSATIWSNIIGSVFNSVRLTLFTLAPKYKQFWSWSIRDQSRSNNPCSNQIPTVSRYHIPGNRQIGRSWTSWDIKILLLLTPMRFNQSTTFTIIISVSRSQEEGAH